MTKSPMMDCGHAANAVWRSPDGDKPVCAICSFAEDGRGQTVIDDPDLSGRTARCTGYGRPPGHRGSCPMLDNAGICRCEHPSDDRERLAFFEHHPDKDHDEFYCGCICGWD
jgi:hypothetical protein